MAIPRQPVPPPGGFAIVPCLWPDATFVVVGAGPSLTQADLDLIRDLPAATRPRVIVVNNTYRLAPWADVLYAADAQWWLWNRHLPDSDFPPLIYGAQPTARQWRASLQILAIQRGDGISTDPGRLVTGGHGGHQAINLAVHLGARSILLLGYDMQPAADGRHHCHEEHPNGTHPTYAARLPGFRPLRHALDALGITIVNCSRRTAIPADVIPRRDLGVALQSCGRRADLCPSRGVQPGDVDPSAPAAGAGGGL